MNVRDIVYALFKHKGKIILGTIIGLIAAGVMYMRWPPMYESDAKLLVRYVVERNAVEAVEGNASSSARGAQTDTEAEILGSWDLSMEVSRALGPSTILPGVSNPTVEAGAGTVLGGLTITTQKGSDLIFLAYDNPNPDLPRVVLQSVIDHYFTKHLEVHRSAAAFDFVTEQADQVRARLSATEQALRDLKAKVGIVSVADNTATLSADIIKLEDQYAAAESDLIEQTARVRQVEESFGGGSSAKKTSGKTPPTPPRTASPEEILQYQAFVNRLGELRKTRLDLLAKYTPQSQTVQLNQAEINTIDRQKHDLEKKFPELVGQTPLANRDSAAVVDLSTERARPAGLSARTEALKNRLDEKMKQLTEVGSQIGDLERKRDLEETNYKYFQQALEKARIDEALDPKKMPNISIIQKPIPPRLVVGKRNRTVAMLAVGGFAVCAGLALLYELLIKRTVNGPLDLEGLPGSPLMVSIPYSAPMKRLANRKKAGRGESALTVTAPTNGDGKAAPWEVDHFIVPYAQGIRDRLNLYFELNRMTHKPKLVGVTGLAEGVGSSTLAASLAAALSDMGDGKVLLVDTSLGVGRVHSFFEGKPAYPLTTALQPSTSMDSASNNLYLATVTPPGSGPMQLALKRFFELMPNLKASDFDYIIFDLPPLDDTTPTLGMARFMDKLLLVVEAEKNGRQQVKRCFNQLSAARANVSVVLNKTKSHVPSGLEGL